MLDRVYSGSYLGRAYDEPKAMVAYSKVKEKEIIPILAWCCWKVRNLMVFEGVAGSAQEARTKVMRLASAAIHRSSCRN